MSPALVLGIDGGGTSTTALLAGTDGPILGRGESGPSNAKAVDADTARRHLQEARENAFASAGLDESTVRVACYGLAGFDRPEDKETLREWVGEGADQLVLVNDGDLVIAAACPDGWGIGLIAGTGSIAVARDRDGRTSRSGGWGPLFGDEGSAYAVALAGLRLTARRADGREGPPGALIRPDRLSVRLCAALDISDPSGLVAAVYGRGLDRAMLAALGPLVVAAAGDGDDDADTIVKQAVWDLAEIVKAAAHRLGWWIHEEKETLPLALAGGFLLHSPTLIHEVPAHLSAWGYPVEAREVPDPAIGAVILARRALG